jgi:hypothetical protein
MGRQAVGRDLVWHLRDRFRVSVWQGETDGPEAVISSCEVLLSAFRLLGEAGYSAR